MSSVVVWIDSEHAKVFNLTPTGMQKKDVKKHSHKHSNSHQSTHKNEEEDHFFHEVAQALGKVEELLIVGPGMAKTHFKSHLEKHHHNELAKAVVGVEATDKHLTENEVLAQARKFFKKAHLFT